MTVSKTIAIIGDHDPEFEPHEHTDRALHELPQALGLSVDAEWVPTDELDGDVAGRLQGYGGLWISPGSPYRNPEGVYEAIRHGRERRVPTLGTCAGFQHMAVEYARNVLGIGRADSVEYGEGADLCIVPLAHSPAGQVMTVRVAPGTKARLLYGREIVRERYYCQNGLAEEFRPALVAAGLVISGEEEDGAARILEVPDHLFYVGTLFVPQARSSVDDPHPVLVGFLRAPAGALHTEVGA